MGNSKKIKKVWPLNGYLFAAFRKVWRWSPERRTCLREGEDKRHRFLCNGCERRFERHQIAVDHKEPVIPPSTGFTSWDEYKARLFVPVSGLQLLCKTCHKEKTRTENAERRKVKKAWHWPFLRVSDGPEYACRHGVGHSRGVHGCEGCCKDPNFPKETK